MTRDCTLDAPLTPNSRVAIGEGWRVRLLLRVGESVSPLCLPAESFAVADLLPDLYGAG